MKVKEIAFLGDSFTWGEGLELYLDSPFWIQQRTQRSMWMDLIHLQNEESTNFREKNRFANIVSQHFNSNCIIDSTNGGWIGNITTYLSNFLESRQTPDYVIIQFSCFNRNPIHYHFGSLFRNCKCKKCNNYIDTIHCFYHFLDTIRKKYVDNEKLDDQHEFYLNWLIDEFNFPILDIENSKDSFVLAFDFVNSIIDSYSYKHLNYLVNEYVTPLESRGVKVFYIDSWDDESSKIIHDIPSIKENLIPLKKWNSLELTQKYSTFEKSFQHTRIQNEFPKSENGHPTLIQHQYIANSIINQIENFDKKFIIKKFL
jgi:hypothetical protein